MMNTDLRAVPDTVKFNPSSGLFADCTKQTDGSKYLDANGRLKCPTCESYDFFVRDSEPWENGSKKRYRCCCGCGLPVKTREVVDDE